MEQVEQDRHASSVRPKTAFAWQGASVTVALISLLLVLAVLIFKIRGAEFPFLLLLLLLAASAAVVLLFSRFLLRAFHEQHQTAEALEQMAGNIQEIFWMVDATTKRALYVNQAYETITGRSCESLRRDPSSYAEAIHPDDLAQILARRDEATRSGYFDERFRILRSDGEVRWVWARGFPVHDSGGAIRRLVGTLLDITAQREAEERVIQNLATAKAAWAEAEAMRKATLALTQDLSMDLVMDTLLRSLAELVPYTCARVLTPEGGPHVQAVGERHCPHQAEPVSSQPWSCIADECTVLKRVLSERKGVLLRDTQREEGWETFSGHENLRSWISVPLVVSNQYLGFLSIGHTEPDRFTEEHLRCAELLAIPAAAAIQNARLYLRAEVYGEELERHISDLRQAKNALEKPEWPRRITD